MFFVYSYAPFEIAIVIAGGPSCQNYPSKFIWYTTIDTIRKYQLALNSDFYS